MTPKRKNWLKYGIFIIGFVLIMVGSLFLTDKTILYIKGWEKYGYLGIFILGIIVNASVILPVPIVVTPILTGFVVQSDPYSVAVIYALGATLGESVSYGVGRIGRKIIVIDRIDRIKKKIANSNSKVGKTGNFLREYSGWEIMNKKDGFYQKGEKWLRKNAEKRVWSWIVILILAAQPILPFDVAGIVAGSLRYPFWKFFTATLTGRIIKYIIMLILGVELWKFWKIIFH